MRQDIINEKREIVKYHKKVRKEHFRKDLTMSLSKEKFFTSIIKCQISELLFNIDDKEERDYRHESCDINLKLYWFIPGSLIRKVMKDI